VAAAFVGQVLTDNLGFMSSFTNVHVPAVSKTKLYLVSVIVDLQGFRKRHRPGALPWAP